MAYPEKTKQTVFFQRRTDFPGVEVRTVSESVNAWRCYSTDFEFLCPTTWHGEVWHRQQSERLGPGLLLCAHPGEVFLEHRVSKPGARRSLTIDVDTLAHYLRAHGLNIDALRLRAVTAMSPRLAHCLQVVFELLSPEPTHEQVDAALSDFVAALVEELHDHTARPPSRLDNDSRAAEWVRECLEQDACGGGVDLSSLAQLTGMSRFQALRAFKRRYGLPPHTYQLRVRLGLAQKSLRQGQRPAFVAAEFGFVDQSHLTRHFKRVLGMTPSQYARIGTGSQAPLEIAA